MNNLIATIIGIALVAIVAISGLLYAGQAFQNASAQAAANKIDNDLGQIIAAAQIYRANNANTDLGQPITQPSWLNNAAYIPVWPQFPQTAGFTSAGSYGVGTMYTYATGASTGTQVAYMTTNFSASTNIFSGVPLNPDNPALDVCVAFNQIHPVPAGSIYGSNTQQTTPFTGAYPIPACVISSSQQPGIAPVTFAKWNVSGTWPNITGDGCCGERFVLFFFRLFGDSKININPGSANSCAA